MTSLSQNGNGLRPGKSVVPRPKGSLKDITNQLVNAGGGQTACAEILGKGHATVARWTDPSEPGRSIPLADVVRLEAVIGEPVITRFMALRNGGVFVPLLPADDSLQESLGRATAEMGEVIQAALVVLADGKVTSKEAGKLLSEISDVQQALATAVAILAHIQREGEADA